ncbi:MAG TPA: tripartite tricarboxylate transporter substrate-binding protein [Xanthobacteraceae bacterium]|jgi:tripartite-type tricarboxylate transporter receptor subunit TctC|nr:tripartite tricarboxylate transporter substrate-binding protein [Xanthobacteraceae bacterium]
MCLSLKRPIGGARSALLLALALAGVMIAAAPARAAYPDRPVRVVLPFGPGGVADVTARLVAEKLSEKLGQNFVIENMPGPGGIAAARAVLSAPADGYTLAFFTNGTAITVPLFSHLPFDPLKQFVPISAVGYFDLDFVVAADSPYRTLGDFLKAAKDKPGTLNLGSIVVGSTQNLTAQLFKSMSGADIVIVPFRTSPDELIALLRNDIQSEVEFYAAIAPSLQSGKARVLATSGVKRSPELPNVPTIAEAGVPNFDVTSWNALYAPAGTPQAVIDTLNGALHDVLADPELKKRALALGIDAEASTPAEIDGRMKSDIAKWTKVIESAHIPKQ